MPPSYALTRRVLLRLCLAILRGRRRSFRQDSRDCIEGLNPPLKVYNRENIPLAGPCLVTVNHYSSPGFRAWWFALGISAVFPCEIHWTITAAWTYPDWFRANTITPGSHWVLQKIAGVYGFTPMPAMPPDPKEALQRAKAVRSVLTYAKKVSQPVIGLAPEGRDFDLGKLGFPSPGVGRFILHLAASGMPVLPVGAFEELRTFCLRFGPPYRVEVSSGLSRVDRDRHACQEVMSKIAMLLPEELRGEFCHEDL